MAVSFKQLRVSTRGFSLPEMMMTIGLIIVISGVVLFRYSSFNSSTLLQSQAFEIALDVRQTQVFSLSVRAEGGQSFREEFGLYFDTSTPGSYIFFQDSGDTVPAVYDSGELIDTITLDPRYQISRICIDDPVTTCNEQDSASISFRRPNFDANISSSPGGTQSDIYIEITSIAGSDTRSVYITNTGQITIE